MSKIQILLALVVMLAPVFITCCILNGWEKALKLFVVVIAAGAWAVIVVAAVWKYG